MSNKLLTWYELLLEMRKLLDEHEEEIQRKALLQTAITGSAVIVREPGKLARVENLRPPEDVA